jgi:hypothetical protein
MTRLLKNGEARRSLEPGPAVLAHAAALRELVHAGRVA